MSSATDLTWFARHEIRLAWREWLAMIAGRRGKRKRAIIALIVFVAIMHLPAYAVIGRFADLQAPLDKPELIVITATIFLAWALMLSQAIESVTRVFYARADLDLIMSSPATSPMCSRCGSRRSGCLSSAWRCCCRRPLSTFW